MKFTEMKVQYHEKRLGFPCRHANEPVEVPPRVEAVKEALRTVLRQSH